MKTLLDPHAEQICKGEKTLVVHAQRLPMFDEPIYVAWDGKVYGVARLASPRPISLAEFRRREEEHKIGEAERKTWWVKARRLYAYKVVEIKALQTPQSLDLIQGTPESRAAGAIVHQLAVQLARTAPDIVKQARKLMAPNDVADCVLTELAAFGDVLAKSFGGPEPAAPAAGNIFELVERLILALHAVANSCNQASAHAQIAKSSIARLADVLLLEPSFSVDDGSLAHFRLQTELAKDADGQRLPVLLVDGPDEAIQALPHQLDRTYLLVTRSSGPEPQYAWGTGVLRADAGTVKLFDVERRQPQLLVDPVLSRTFGPDVNLETGLVKQEDTETTVDEEGEIAPWNEDDKPWLSFRGVTPAMLQELSDDELLEFHTLGLVLLKTQFVDGRTSLGGLSREDVENALAFVEDELGRRGLKGKAPQADLSPDVYKGMFGSSRYAPVHSGSKGELPELGLDEVLGHMHEEFLLRSPFVYLVGSTANHGVTRNDVDVLIRGPLDKVTTHVVKFRLGRMMPPKISERVRFHGGFVSDTESSISLAGPFGSHMPIYDLVVRRRRDYRSRVEMRDAGIRYEPLETLLVKADPFLDLPEKEQPFSGVLQHHIRGASIHADLRVGGAKNYLVGYTLADGVQGKFKEPESFVEAKKLVSSFSIDGSEWNKSFVAPSRLYVALKSPQPKDWESVEGEFEPGTVGATRNKKGFMVITAKPQVSWGERTSSFHEYFLEKDARFCGRLVFRLLVSEGSKPEDTEVEASRRSPKGTAFWTAMLAKSLLPSVLNPAAVEAGRIPPQDWSYLPPGLKAAVPKEFQYWHSTDEKERLEIRDALVAEEIFIEDNVRLVNSEFRRVVAKYFLSPALDRMETGLDGDTGYIPPSLPCPPTAVQDAPSSAISQEKSETIERADAIPVVTATSGQSHAHHHLAKVNTAGTGGTTKVIGHADDHVHEISGFKVAPAVGYIHDVKQGHVHALPKLAAMLKKDVEPAESVVDAVAKSVGSQRHLVKLIKQEEEERYVLGVVLVPDEYDSQADTYDAPTVRKAAHWFMEEAQRLGLQHQATIGRDKLRVLESFVAPTNMEIEGSQVKKGTWLMAARVLDDELWAAVKDGRLTGWSIEGYALAAELT